MCIRRTFVVLMGKKEKFDEFIDRLLKGGFKSKYKMYKNRNEIYD